MLSRAVLSCAVLCCACQATPKPLIVDRTLRYYCPERDLLQVSLPLSSSASSRAGGLPVPAQGVTGLASAGGSAQWTAVSDNQLVMLAVTAAPQQQQQPQGGRAQSSSSSSGEGGGAQLSLRFKCGTSPEVCHFHVWVYADALQARPLEVWQVRGAAGPVGPTSDTTSDHR